MLQGDDYSVGHIGHTVEPRTVMPPRAPVFLGELEQMVLLTILHLGEEAYAVPIREALLTRAGRRIARGALYTTLERLETKGYLQSWFSDSTPERGGRARRYFAVTPRGVALLRTSHETWRTLYEGLEPILGSTE